MSENIFLQEMSATVAFFDVRRFSELAASLSPTDLAVALGSFYRHVEQGVLESGGRVVKFISDAALTLFPSVGGADHAGNALRLVRTMVEGAPAWQAEHRKSGLPEMVYSVGVASGNVLHGSLGTPRQRAFDVLGRPVTQAIRLARLATVRHVPNLVAHGTVIAVSGDAIPCIEVEGVELTGEPLRLFRVLAGEDATTGGTGEKD